MMVRIVRMPLQPDSVRTGVGRGHRPTRRRPVLSSTRGAGKATMSTTQQSATVATPKQLGVGARFSIHPHCDDFVAVILGALDDVARDGLTDGLVLETDERSEERR